MWLRNPDYCDPFPITAKPNKPSISLDFKSTLLGLSLLSVAWQTEMVAFTSKMIYDQTRNRWWPYSQKTPIPRTLHPRARAREKIASFPEEPEQLIRILRIRDKQIGGRRWGLYDTPGSRKNWLGTWSTFWPVPIFFRRFLPLVGAK